MEFTSSLSGNHHLVVHPFDRYGSCSTESTGMACWFPLHPKSADPICFSPYLYRARNRVERFFNRIKQCRRIATRYDKLAANYLAFVQLASIRLWLRLNESGS